MCLMPSKQVNRSDDRHTIWTESTKFSDQNSSVSLVRMCPSGNRKPRKQMPAPNGWKCSLCGQASLPSLTLKDVFRDSGWSRCDWQWGVFWNGILTAIDSNGVTNKLSDRKAVMVWKVAHFWKSTALSGPCPSHLWEPGVFPGWPPLLGWWGLNWAGQPFVCFLSRPCGLCHGTQWVRHLNLRIWTGSGQEVILCLLFLLLQLGEEKEEGRR